MVARYILFCCLYSVSVCIILVYFGLYPALIHTSQKSYVVVVAVVMFTHYDSVNSFSNTYVNTRDFIKLYFASVLSL